jgi:hypothetical protein
MVALDRLVWGWSERLVSLTLVTVDSMRTIGPGLPFSFFGAFQNDSGSAMAASIFTVLAFVLVRRRFVYGLTDAPVKSSLEVDGSTCPMAYPSDPTSAAAPSRGSNPKDRRQTGWLRGSHDDLLDRGG